MKILDAASAAWDAVKSVYTTTTLHLSTWYAGLVATWGGVSYEALARRAYRNPTASRGLRLIGQLMAAVPFVVEDAEGTMSDDHEMLRLVDRPNARTSRGFLFDQITAHLFCAGEVFFRRIAPDSGENAGKPTANGASLSLLSPGAFEEFRREAGVVTEYVFNEGGRRVAYPADEVLHVRVFNPGDTDRGMPLLLGAARALDQMEAADEWNKAVANGRGRDAGYLYPQLADGQQLTREQVALAQEINDADTLERRARNLPKVMSGSFKFESASMTLRDADFLKAGEANDRRVCAVLGLSPRLVYVANDTGGLTDAGMDSEVRAAYLLTVLPLLDFVLSELNAWLGPLYGVRLAYDRDQIEALQDDVNELYKRYVLACGGPFLTPDEAREANGYEPRGGALDEVRSVAVSAGGVSDGDDDGEAGEGQDADLAVRAIGDGVDFDLTAVRLAVAERLQAA